MSDCGYLSSRRAMPGRGELAGYLERSAIVGKLRSSINCARRLVPEDEAHRFNVRLRVLAQDLEEGLHHG